MCCSRKKGFRHLFTFTIKAWTYTDVPARPAHFTHSALIFRNRKTQRSLIRGRGTSIHLVTYSSAKTDLGEDEFTSYLDIRTHGHRTDFGTKLIYPFFHKKNSR